MWPSLLSVVYHEKKFINLKEKNKQMTPATTKMKKV